MSERTATAHPPTPALRSIADLPYDVLLHLLTFLPGDDIIRLLSTSRTLRSVMDEEIIWKELVGRHGIYDTSAFGHRSFYAVYTGLLHTYAPLLGIWAGDNPFTGSILEFRLDHGSDRRPGCIIGELWRFRALEAEEAEQVHPPEPPKAAPVVVIAFPDQMFPDEQQQQQPAVAAAREAHVFCCWDWDAGAPDDWHTADLRMMSETTQGTVLYTRHGSFLHPDFPNDELSKWHDVTRPLPHLCVVPHTLVDQSTELSAYRRPRVPELFAAPTIRTLPKALSVTCPHGCMQMRSPLGYKNHHPCPPRYYPLRLDILPGIPPASDQWSPESLIGIWLGTYSSHGTEVVFFDWDEARRSLYGLKITGDEHVPRGVVSWNVPVDRPCTVAPDERQMCVRAFGRDTSGFRLYRGTGVVSARGYLPHEQDTPPVIMGVLGPDELRILWTEDEDVYSFIRYRGRSTVQHEPEDPVLDCENS